VKRSKALGEVGSTAKTIEIHPHDLEKTLKIEPLRARDRICADI
jgi:hypothetical protein